MVPSSRMRQPGVFLVPRSFSAAALPVRAPAEGGGQTPCHSVDGHRPLDLGTGLDLSKSPASLIPVWRLASLGWLNPVTITSQGRPPHLSSSTLICGKVEADFM